MFGNGTPWFQPGKKQEPPKKNGVVITPEEPQPAKYEYYRDGLLLGRFNKCNGRWGYRPVVQQYRDSVIDYHERLTLEEVEQIAAQLRILNEQSTKEGA